MGEGGHSGSVRLRGELWSFQSAEVVAAGDSIRAIGVEGLKVFVEKVNNDV